MYASSCLRKDLLAAERSSPQQGARWQEFDVAERSAPQQGARWQEIDVISVQAGQVLSQAA